MMQMEPFYGYLDSATLTFARQLDHLTSLKFKCHSTHIVGKMREIQILYSILQFEVHERGDRH